MAKRSKLKNVIVEQKRATLHDRRATDIPANAEVGVVTRDDPFGLPAEIALSKRGEWLVGERERVTVVLSFRSDPIGRMYARNQIGSAEYEAARAFQRLHDEAELGVIKAIDPSDEYVDGGLVPDMLTDRRANAIKKIRSVELAIAKKHGSEGVSVIRGLLVDKTWIGDIARDNGGGERRNIEFYGSLLLRCLRSLGIEMGTIRQLNMP